MAMKTVHIVQPFERDEWGTFNPLPGRMVETRDLAKRIAQRLHEQHKRVLVIARTGDFKMGDYERPELIENLGGVPQEIVELVMQD